MHSRINPDAQIVEIIFDVTGKEKSLIQPTAHLHRDLGMDSMDKLTVGFELETTFEIDIDDKLLAMAETVDDLTQIVIKKLNPI